MATNVDFFRSFAEDTSGTKECYYFEHSRDELDFSNLYDAESPEDDQLKIVHFTNPRGVNVLVNDSSKVEGVMYRGAVFALYKSDLDQTLDVQAGNEKSDGKYEKYVKCLIENGGVLAEIADFNACNDNYDFSSSGASEVYNMFDWNGDGIFFEYELTIRITDTI